MLEIKFSHLQYAKVLPIGGLPLRPDEHTYLLNYCVVPELSPEFVERDTKYYPPGKCFEQEAKYFQLGPGPYLILFLKTVTEKWEHLPHYWQTVREPWKDTDRRCGSCSKYYTEDPSPAILGRWLPCSWPCDLPQKHERWRPRNIPEKYRQARGREVRIVYTGDEQPEPLELPDFNANGKEAARAINAKQGGQS